MKRIIFFLLLALPALACSSQLTRPIATPTTEAPTQAARLQLLQLAPTETAIPADTCTVTAQTSLNLRKDPGTDAAGIAVLSHGDLVTILDDPQSGNWIKVRAGSITGWINSTYCKRERTP